MGKELLDAINNIYEWLSKYKELEKIYNIAHNKNNLKDVVYLSDVSKIDKEKVIECISLNIEYLLSLNNTKYILEKKKDENEIFKNLDTVDRLIKTDKKTNIDFIEDEVYLLLKTNAMLTVYCCICISVGNINDLIDENYYLKENNMARCYYRGHSDYSYNLLPSIYRDLPLNNEILDYNKLCDLYLKANLTDKYCNIFDSKTVDYNFCAYMQHSKEYSPLLDFTNDYFAALSFATTSYNKPINAYYKKDAAIFELSINKTNIIENEIEASDKLKQLDVYISNRKLDVLSNVRGKPLYYCTYKDFETEVSLIETKATNDRMKYQRGCFLLIIKCVIINGVILMPIDFGYIKKYKISAKKKFEIYDYICKNKKRYEYNHLMDPYLYFYEAPLK